MIWREAQTAAEREAFRRISCEPMEGRIRLVWGFSKLQAPAGCSDFKLMVMEQRGAVVAGACRWRWPDGSLYLGGLRVSRELKERPGPRTWRQAYLMMLGEDEHAWTTIGTENLRARRLLERGASYLPHYRPVEELVTWFEPAAGWPGNRNGASSRRSGLVEASWRQVEVAGGRGWSWRCGRALHRLGLPGIPPPGKALRIGFIDTGEPAGAEAPGREAPGPTPYYDGVVEVRGEGSRPGGEGAGRKPRFAWSWRSRLYSVSWDKGVERALPGWKGHWL